MSLLVVLFLKTGSGQTHGIIAAHDPERVPLRDRGFKSGQVGGREIVSRDLGIHRLSRELSHPSLDRVCQPVLERHHSLNGRFRACVLLQALGVRGSVQPVEQGVFARAFNVPVVALCED